MLQHKNELLIPASYTDAHAQLTTVGAFTLMQDIAGEHAERMGVGFKALLDNSSAFWVIARTRLKLIRPARIYEPVTLTTWPSKPAGAICIRNYELTSDAGETLFLGKNEWVVMDAVTHRVRRLSTTCYPIDAEYSDRIALPEPFSRFDEQPAPEHYAYTHRLRYSDTDHVRHTNNVSYVRILLDSLSSDFFEENIITDFEIKYIHESREGDDIAVYRIPTQEGCMLFGKNAEGEIIVSAKLTAQKR